MLVLLEMTHSTRLEDTSHMTNKWIMLNKMICDLNIKLNVDSLILLENHLSGGPNIYAAWLEHYISCRKVLMINQFWFIMLHSVAGSKLQFKVGLYVYVCVYIYIYTRIYIYAQSLSHVRLFVTPWNVAYQARNLPGKNIGVGCHAFLQGIF